MFLLEKIGIIGAGCYGTAIAQCFSRRAKEILLISRSKTVASAINELHMNPQAFPEITLAPNIICSDVFFRIQDCNVIFFALPVAAVLAVCKQIKEYEIKAPLILCSKGFDVENCQLQSDLVEEILDNSYAILSGPSFAHEIARWLSAGVNIASKNAELSRHISESLSSATFKIEVVDDYIGLQVAGALKNVLAIGCGVFSGLKLGGSAITKLIVDGLHEMADFAVAMGGKKETFFELGGIGDTILTCNSRQSRNVLFGEHLASGGHPDNWTGALAEGVFTAKAIPLFMQKYNLSLKIFPEIYRMIYERRNLSETISKTI
ncbi:MAG: NAD(P)H-dependent glycerol-3-phosphate dehydrogenase [Holosporaceae bacterium]|nr:NAD(P)H-dependent glycerol-3-phosphate dehydrogenase [Holosporaceae bacterium]